jgi:CRP-like cAMP-binding protein
MGQAEQRLCGIELLQTVPAQELEALAKRCRWSRHSAGQLIVGHRDESTDVFFIVAGMVRAIVYSRAGKEVTFRDIGTGESFGEYAAIDGQLRSASVVARTDSLTAAMPARVYWEVLKTHPEVSAAVLKDLTRQVRALSERVFEFSALAVRNRIHAELLRLARADPAQGKTAVISPAPTHADIASRISTHREAVSRELSALSREGLIERRGQELVIRDLDRLARMVEEVLGT